MQQTKTSIRWDPNGWEGDLLGIVQEIEVWQYEQICTNQKLSWRMKCRKFSGILITIWNNPFGKLVSRWSVVRLVTTRYFFLHQAEWAFHKLNPPQTPPQTNNKQREEGRKDKTWIWGQQNVRRWSLTHFDLLPECISCMSIAGTQLKS